MTAAPDFESLRSTRNRMVLEAHQRLAEELGISLDSMKSNFNPNACYCACPAGPCEHKWDGEEYTSEDECCFSATCSRCGSTAMSHDLRVLP